MNHASSPHIAVVGAGSIGCYIGGRLQDSGARVTLVGRPTLAAAVATHGLSLSDLAGYRRHVEPGAVTFRTDLHAVAHAGLVLVTVKSGATAAVAAELAAALTRPTVVLSLQNGLRNADVLRRHLPAHVVLAGMVPFNVVQTPPAAFHQGSSGLLMAQPDPRLAPQGEVIALAAELGREAPVNARLLALIREAEERRVAITGEELLAELRAAESTPRNPRP